MTHIWNSMCWKRRITSQGRVDMGSLQAKGSNWEAWGLKGMLG